LLVLSLEGIFGISMNIEVTRRNLRSRDRSDVQHALSKLTCKNCQPFEHDLKYVLDRGDDDTKATIRKILSAARTRTSNPKHVRVEVNVLSLAGEVIFGPEMVVESTTISRLISRISTQNRIGCRMIPELLIGDAVLHSNEVLRDIRSEGDPLELTLALVASSLPCGTFTVQRVIGFHIARRWWLAIGANGEAKWAHETYIDDPGDYEPPMSCSGFAAWCDDGTEALQLTVWEDGVQKQFRAEVSSHALVVEGSDFLAEDSFGGPLVLDLVTEKEEIEFQELIDRYGKGLYE